MQRDIELIEVNKILGAADFQNRCVLEIGCGDGRVTQHLAQKSIEYHAIDPDANELSTAKQRIPHVSFDFGYGEKLFFKDEYFDLVLFSLSLHHQNADSSLAEAARVLKKQGKVIVVEPAPDGEIQRIFHIFKDETRQLNFAQNSINSSSFKLLKREVFKTVWQFRDFQEIIEYDFYESRGMDEYQIKQIKEIIGSRINSSPIRLTDTLLLTVLRKE